jgi:hypothetical protein
VDDLTRDGVGQRDVGADVQPQPAIRPLGRAGASRIDNVQPGPIADGFEDVQEEDGMRLARIRTPENDEVGLLDLTV